MKVKSGLGWFEVVNVHDLMLPVIGRLRTSCGLCHLYLCIIYPSNDVVRTTPLGNVARVGKGKRYNLMVRCRYMSENDYMLSRLHVALMLRVLVSFGISRMGLLPRRGSFTM